MRPGAGPGCILLSSEAIRPGCALPLDCLLYSPQLASEIVITLPPDEPTPVPLSLATDGLMVRIRPAARPEFRWSAPLTIAPLGTRRAGLPARLRCALSSDAASAAEAAAAAANRRAARTPDLAPAPLGGLGGGGGAGEGGYNGDEHAAWDPAWCGRG